MRITSKLVSVLVLASLAGCSTLSSLNPFAKKEEPRNPPAALVEFNPTLPVATGWSVPVGKADAYLFAPAVVAGSVYAAAADGTLTRIEARTGGAVWRINAGMPLTAGVGSDGLTVAVAAEKGVLLAFDGEGKQRWKAQASSEILSAPAVGQGLVLVRSVDNRIAAYDADTGARRWVVERSAPPLTLRTAPGILINGPVAYVGLPGGRLLALSLANGGPLWEVPVGDPRGATELERIADISGTPVLAGREVCAVAYQGRIACFDASTGTARWARQLSSEVGLGIDERNLYAADERGVVSAFGRDSGAGVWRNNRLANRGLSVPVALGRAVAVGDAQGYVHFLSREDGGFVARVFTDGSPVIAGAPLVEGRSAVFQTQAGSVIALVAE